MLVTIYYKFAADCHGEQASKVTWHRAASLQHLCGQPLTTVLLSNVGEGRQKMCNALIWRYVTMGRRLPTSEVLPMGDLDRI